jgi:hypothetical protein
MVRYSPVPMKDKNWRLAAVTLLTAISGTMFYRLRIEKSEMMDKTETLSGPYI